MHYTIHMHCTTIINRQQCWRTCDMTVENHCWIPLSGCNTLVLFELHHEALQYLFNARHSWHSTMRPMPSRGARPSGRQMGRQVEDKCGIMRPNTFGTQSKSRSLLRVHPLRSVWATTRESRKKYGGKVAWSIRITMKQFIEFGIGKVMDQRIEEIKCAEAKKRKERLDFEFCKQEEQSSMQPPWSTHQEREIAEKQRRGKAESAKMETEKQKIDVCKERAKKRGNRKANKQSKQKNMKVKKQGSRK